MSAIDLSGYEITDSFFGAPFIEVDEERERPSPHRFVQGGFEGTDQGRAKATFRADWLL